MDTLEHNNKLLINVSAVTHTATLFLSGHFTFGAHREFKAAYWNHLKDAKIKNIVVDLEKIQYMDSSALGMLLVLLEHVQSAGKSLVLSRPSLFTKLVFDIANFQDRFVIV